MFEDIQSVIDKIDFESISNSRKEELDVLSQFIQQKKDEDNPVRLNFICTHNSRRSQFAQLWSKVASYYYRIPVHSYSGGVEITSANERTINSLLRFGFEIDKDGDGNPKYSVRWKKEGEPLIMYSKLYNEANNPSTGFAAIMTCSDADENCPLIIGCEQRILLRYNDPKTFDQTPLESAMYDYRSFEIASELFYIFSKIK